MSPEVIALVGRMQLVAGVAILAVFALRRLRSAFDPDTRVWLWTIPPIAALACLLPREDVGAVVARSWADHLAPVATAVTAVWLLGVIAMVVYVGLQHTAFLRLARRGLAGPAVTGLLWPRIVMPKTQSFTPEERALILAHEREHIRRKDLAVRGVVLLTQCLFWFNPLVHLAADAIRFDQELACDEAVTRVHGRKRLYAEALLKCHLTRPSPLGCHWLTIGAHPLEIRLKALAEGPVSESKRVLSTGFGLALATVTAILAWEANPPIRPPVIKFETGRPDLPGLNLPRIDLPPARR